ncbi:hypothetical protein BC792_107102 [Sphingobacterium allocomposti]|jgi:hypothetical protein|uniref:Lipoprotein n=1 Tax=Sphingobacterium allocomposti TaxID=415956 RepID=A0A5S5DJS0_9SPHI|nr:hypothetical protein [Sphingobacterium composti Yoo et al. 2007 non Ten et al. 2007]TYP96203.1 hypothetical protein BC792_107102 [Sphingobacterium composti Yoo et al. 2007 non Ten et al. 2007]HLS94901.1 hypothetical protein [Sphingobacterium sp.]
MNKQIWCILGLSGLISILGGCQSSTNVHNRPESAAPTVQDDSIGDSAAREVPRDSIMQQGNQGTQN